MKKYPIIKRPKSYLKAISEAIEYLLNDPDTLLEKIFYDNDICKIATKIRNNKQKDTIIRLDPCKYCPWILFEDMYCPDAPKSTTESLTPDEELKLFLRWKRIIKGQIKRKEAKKK